MPGNLNPRKGGTARSLQKNGEKSAETGEKQRSARNRPIFQETKQDLPGAPQFSLPQAHKSLRLFIAIHYFM